VVTDQYMFNQLGMVLKVLPEYAERAASKLRASGEHGVLSYGPFNPTTDRPVSVKLHVRCVRQPRCPTSADSRLTCPTAWRVTLAVHANASACMAST
jgi:hypothetical protein